MTYTNEALQEIVDNLASHSMLEFGLAATLLAERKERSVIAHVATADDFGAVANLLTHGCMYVTEGHASNAHHCIDEALGKVREWQRGCQLKGDVRARQQRAVVTDEMVEHVCIDRGAVKMALNVLRRMGKAEVANELEKSCYTAQFGTRAAVQSALPAAATCAVCDGPNKYDPESGVCAHCQDVEESPKPAAVSVPDGWEESLNHELIVETERAIRQRDEFLRTGVSTAGHGGSHDTCFATIVRRHIAMLATAPAQGECQGCHGSGTVRATTYGLGPDDHQIDIDCPSCEGTGEQPAQGKGK